jgi:hypothetical protein
MYFADKNGNMCTKCGSSQLESSHCIVNNNTPGGNTGIETAQWALRLAFKFQVQLSSSS